MNLPLTIKTPGRTHVFHILPLLLSFITNSSTSGHPTTTRSPFNQSTRFMENLRTRRIRNSPMQGHQSAAVDCFFFVYYGTCGFGRNCMFNHPDPVHHLADQEATRENTPARYAPIPCKFFLAGHCKFGNSCKFDHSLTVPLAPLASYSLHFNVFGFPKRWGEPNCLYYMHTGICGHGTACRFHHPEPVFYYPYQGYGYNVGDEVIEYQNRYAQLSNGWNQRRVTITIKEPCVALNDVGLPLRPEKKVCRDYENMGCCKYGRGCKFNHPLK